MANDIEIKTEDKFPGKILSPAQGPQKMKAKPATVHPNALGQMMRPPIAATVDSALLEEARSNGTIDTDNETLGEFVGKHAVAQANGNEWVETSEKNMAALLDRKQWQSQGYFCYKGVKVCAFGKIEQIEAAESKTAHDRMHPGAQPTVLSG